MTTDREATAQLVEDVAEALLRFAARLRETPQPGARIEEATDTAPPRPERRRRGGAQRAIIAQLRHQGPDGATAATLAQATGQKQPNVLRTLRALADRGQVVSDGRRPAVWRIAD